MWMRAFYCFFIKMMVNLEEGQKHLSSPYCCLVIFLHAWASQGMFYFLVWLKSNNYSLEWEKRETSSSKQNRSVIHWFQKEAVARMVVPTCHWPEMIGQVSVNGKALPKPLSLQALSSWEAWTWAREVMSEDSSYVLAIQWSTPYAI